MSWYGCLRKMVLSLLSPSTPPWSIGGWNRSPMVLFGILGCPRELAFFAWEATWTKILTLDQLKKRGWRIPNRCYLCKEAEETSDHILIHYLKARLLR